MLVTIVLVRHGETEWSATGKHTSTTDVPLLESGRRDAERLRERLAGRSFALVLTSPYARARETATLAGFGDARDRPGPRGVRLRRVRGPHDARDPRDAAGLERVDRRRARRRDRRRRWASRADRVIERALAAGGDVAVFAHGHLLRVLAARYIDLPASHGGHLALSTGSVSELGFERERRVIWLWNDTYHLR